MGYEVAKRIAFFLGLASLGTTVPHQDLNELILHFLMCPSSIQNKTITHFPENFFSNPPRQSCPVEHVKIAAVLTHANNKRSKKCKNNEPQNLSDGIKDGKKKEIPSPEDPSNVYDENTDSAEEYVPLKILKMGMKAQKMRGRRRKGRKRIGQRKKVTKKFIKKDKNPATVDSGETERVLNIERHENGALSEKEMESTLDVKKHSEKAVGLKNMKCAAVVRSNEIKAVDVKNMKCATDVKSHEIEAVNVKNVESATDAKGREIKTVDVKHMKCVPDVKSLGIKAENMKNMKCATDVKSHGIKAEDMKNMKCATDVKSHGIKDEDMKNMKCATDVKSHEIKAVDIKSMESTLNVKKRKRKEVGSSTDIKTLETKAVDIKKIESTLDVKRYKRKEVESALTLDRHKWKATVKTEDHSSIIPPLSSDQTEYQKKTTEGSDISTEATVGAVTDPLLSGVGELRSHASGKVSSCGNDDKLYISAVPCNEGKRGSNRPLLPKIPAEKKLGPTSLNTSNTPVKLSAPLNEKSNMSHEGFKIKAILLPPPCPPLNSSKGRVATFNNSTSSPTSSPKIVPMSSIFHIEKPTSLLKQQSSVSQTQTSELNSSAKQKVFLYKNLPSNSSAKQNFPMFKMSQEGPSKNQTTTLQTPQSNSSKRYILYQGSKTLHPVSEKANQLVNQLMRNSPNLQTKSNQLGKSSPNLVLLNDKTLQSKGTGVSVNARPLQTAVKLSPKVTRIYATPPNTPNAKSSPSTCITQFNNNNNSKEFPQTASRSSPVVGKSLPLETLQKCLQQINKISLHKNCIKQVQIFKLPSKSPPSSMTDSVKNGNILVIPVKNNNPKPPVSTASATASTENASIPSNGQNRSLPRNPLVIKTTKEAFQRMASFQKMRLDISSDAKNPVMAPKPQPSSHPVKLTANEEYVLPCDISSMPDNIQAEVDSKCNKNSIDQSQENATAIDLCSSGISETRKSPLNSSKRYADSGSDSDYDEEPLSHLIGHPSDETLFNHVHDLVIGSSLESITMRNVLQQVYSLYPQFDLSYRKSFLKDTVKKIVCSISSGHWSHD